MAARAEAARSPLDIDGRDLGMAIHQPFRRRRGRRAQDDLETRGAERVDRATQPRKFEPPRLRLQPAPGEFADANIANAHLAHSSRVVRPQGLRPMFGIVADAEHAMFPVREKQSLLPLLREKVARSAG